MFQGWIAFNPKVILSGSERYLVSVHELGHLLGLRHDPNVSSVMYFVRVDGPVFLDSADLASLGAHHTLRGAPMSRGLSRPQVPGIPDPDLLRFFTVYRPPDGR